MAQARNDEGGVSANEPGEQPRPAFGQRGEPTEKETQYARNWLVKRGVDVVQPSRFLAVRLGNRRYIMRHSAGWYFAAFGILLVLMLGYLYLKHGVLGVDGQEMMPSGQVYFLVVAMQVIPWAMIQRAERHLPSMPRPRDLPRSKPVDVWYVLSAVITFAGGAALAVVIYFTTPARIYALSWLSLLGLSAVCWALLLNHILRRPVRAEDEGSLAVDALLRAGDAYALHPALFTLPVLTELIGGSPVPPGFSVWLLFYVALGIGGFLAGASLLRSRRLPSGYYGVTQTKHDNENHQRNTAPS